MNEPLLRFEHRQGQTTTEKLLIAKLSGYSLKGDWLNDPPTLDSACNFAHASLEELPRKALDKHNRIKIERLPSSVTVTVVGATTHKERLLCAFHRLANHSNMPVSK